MRYCMIFRSFFLFNFLVFVLKAKHWIWHCVVIISIWFLLHLSKINIKLSTCQLEQYAVIKAWVAFVDDFLYFQCFKLCFLAPKSRIVGWFGGLGEKTQRNVRLVMNLFRLAQDLVINLDWVATLISHQSGILYSLIFLLAVKFVTNLLLKVKVKPVGVGS